MECVDPCQSGVHADKRPNPDGSRGSRNVSRLGIQVDPGDSLLTGCGHFQKLMRRLLRCSATVSGERPGDPDCPWCARDRPTDPIETLLRDNSTRRRDLDKAAPATYPQRLALRREVEGGGPRQVNLTHNDVPAWIDLVHPVHQRLVSLARWVNVGTSDPDTVCRDRDCRSEHPPAANDPDHPPRTSAHADNLAITGDPDGSKTVREPRRIDGEREETHLTTSGIDTGQARMTRRARALNRKPERSLRQERKTRFARQSHASNDLMAGGARASHRPSPVCLRGMRRQACIGERNKSEYQRDCKPD